VFQAHPQTLPNWNRRISSADSAGIPNWTALTYASNSSIDPSAAWRFASATRRKPSLTLATAAIPAVAGRAAQHALASDVALVNIRLVLKLLRCQASPGAPQFGREYLGEGHAAEAQSRWAATTRFGTRQRRMRLVRTLRRICRMVTHSRQLGMTGLRTGTWT